MKKKLLVGLLSCLLPLAGSAENLLQAYQESLSTDPTYKAAQAQYLATKESIPIARSALLPNIGLTASSQRQYVEATTTINVLTGIDLSSDFYNTQDQLELTITQPIFNYSSWFSLRNADANVKAAEATYFAAQQSLMLRVAQAYFGVLQAVDTLRYTEAQKQAVGQQLKQTRQQYQVGLIAITGVNEAQANYDSILANEISAKVQLANAMETLRAITNKAYPNLMGLNSKLPLVNPNPADITQWLDIAERQNYSLLAAVNAANAARENIEIQQGGHYPILNATGGYSYLSNTNSFALSLIRQKEATAGLSLTLPVYQGGLINAQTRQARFQYDQAISNMEFTHRSIITQTSNAYLGVFSGISKIQADQQTIVSAQSALASTKAGYEVGTRTILDVLNTQTSLYQAQLAYTQDRYAYLINLLTLKQAAGTLSFHDLIQMNTWLHTNVPIIINTPGIKPGYYPMPAQVVSTDNNYSSKLTRNSLRQQSIAKPKNKKIVKAQPKQAAMMPANKVTAGTYYAIELFAGKVEQHAKNFIQQYHLQGKANYYRAQLPSGNIRYVVVYGSYATKAAAKAALTTLPQSLQQLHPFVTKVKK